MTTTDTAKTYRATSTLSASFKRTFIVTCPDGSILKTATGGRRTFRSLEAARKVAEELNAEATVVS